MKIRFVDCTLADASEKLGSTPPILFTSSRGDEQPIGGVEFVHCTIKEPVDRPLMKYYDAVGLPICGICGTLTVERNGQRTTHVVDQALVDRLMPVDPALTIRRVAWDGLRLRPAGQPATPASLKIPPHRLRDHAVYLLYAEQGQTVAFRVRHRPVGRVTAPPMPVEVLGPGGNRVGRLAVDLGREADHSFQAVADRHLPHHLPAAIAHCPTGLLFASREHPRRW